MKLLVPLVLNIEQFLKKELKIVCLKKKSKGFFCFFWGGDSTNKTSKTINNAGVSIPLVIYYEDYIHG